MAPVVSKVNKFRISIELGSLFEQLKVCYGELGISHCVLLCSIVLGSSVLDCTTVYLLLTSSCLDRLSISFILRELLFRLSNILNLRL